MMNVVVANLSRRMTDDNLRWLFGDFGIVNHVSIWVDYEDRSLRFAIVQMRHSKDAEFAIKELSGKRIARRFLWVDRAPKEFGALRRLCAEASRKRKTRRLVGLSLLNPDGDSFFS
jgi:RNA recognition motif-containing protein